MQLKFTKMHGSGNDFMVVDATQTPFELTSEQMRELSDRHKGVGFDQLLVVGKAEPNLNHEELADFSYRIFNADGSEVEQCGNGVRCFARFVHNKGLTDKTKIAVDTCSGRVYPELQPDGTVRVNMGKPDFTPAHIPLITNSQAKTYEIQVDGDTYAMGAVSMGNPHAVIWVDDVNTADVERIGLALQSHPNFPKRVNVGFVQKISNNHIKLRVFERGVGETQACGTGACGAVAVGILQGQLDSKVRVSLLGGELLIEWAGEGEPLYMTGDAVTVFEGRWHGHFS